MAMATCSLRFEMDLIHDAIADIERIMRALVKCHGQPYRSLERRIENLVEGEIDLSAPAFHVIEPGLYAVDVWPEVKAIIAEARKLQVI